MTACAPCAAATVIAVVMPRSLNEPVGLRPSTFRYTSQPVRADSTGAGSSGVPPSWSVTGVMPAVIGSRSAYSVMMPRHGARAPVVTAAVFMTGLPLLLPASRSPPPGRPAAPGVRRRSPRGPRRAASCVTMMSSASSPLLVCRTAWMETPCLAKASRDRGEHARLVRHVQGDVIPGQRIAHGPHWQLGVGGELWSPGAGEAVARDRHHVAEHRGRRRRAAGARAVEHQPSRRLRLDEHRVVRAADRGERVRPRDHRRVDAHRDAVSRTARRSRAA